VRVAIYPQLPSIADEVRFLIDRLSNAVGVSFEMTSRNVNLAIVVDTPINEGDKPNPVLWKRVGLSEKMYDIVSESGSWDTGCGLYSFSSEDGQVGLSITFADSKLEPGQLRNCLIEGAIRSFGLRARKKGATLTS
jgi:hypothetical protein